MFKSIYAKYLFLVFTLCMFLFGCNVRKENALFKSNSDIITDTLKQVIAINEQANNEFYEIRPGDRLLIKNIQDKEFGKTRNTDNKSNESIQNNQTFEVDELGNVKIPSLDAPLHVQGLTRRAVTKKIQEIFEGPTKLNNPIMEVTILNLKVTLLGEFSKQGNYLLDRDHISLIEIIGEAGGLTKEADPKSVKIIRGNRANPEIIYVNLTDVNSLASKKLLLQNDDIVVIQQQKAYATSSKLQNLNNLVQPILVLLNVGLLILTITK